jgi:predicted  nucleic acid-binding Zn-ribbon protein
VEPLNPPCFRDLAGALRVPEDPIAHSELAALTRRFEEVTEKSDREFGIIKSDLTAVRLQVGNLDQKVDRLDGRLEALGQQISRNQAQIVELLTQLVGKSPDAD